MNIMKYKSIIPVAALALSLGFTSCVNDLDKGNIDPTVTGDADFQGLYNKCYAGLIMEGLDGSADFTIDDAGKSTLLRNIYNFNELSTDEGICWWSDGGIIEIGYNQCEPSHASLKFLYYRIMSNITYCNQFLELGCTDKAMVAEVRFLRAYYYYLMLDFFGDPPFVEKISSEAPLQAHAHNSNFDSSKAYSRAELVKLGQEFMYNWIISELETAEPDMLEAKPETDTEEGYGRADKAAAWLLLSRMYLNAEVYTGTAQWAKAKEYAGKIINESSYSLFEGSSHYTKEDLTCDVTAYDMLFMGDNGSNGASCEAILPLLQDGITTKGWGGSLFFIAALWNANQCTVTGQSAGTTGNTWAGMRVRPEFVEKFVSDTAIVVGKSTQEIRALGIDDRALLWGKGYTDNDKYINRFADLGDNSSFSDGITVTKWNNNYSNGGDPHDSYDVDTDFFLLRFAEAYLNYVEADVRLNGSANETDQQYINKLRSRAHASTVTASDITLDFILDERAREFYCEGQRRTDLIRFGQYGGSQASYQWQYKGGAKNGVNFDAYRNLYPLPQSEIDANSNLTQINGYN